MADSGWMMGLYMLGSRLRRPRQSTWVYCPGCMEDLVHRVGHDGTRLLDEGDGSFVKYLCGKCNTLSTWDFDSYPGPVLEKAVQHRIWYRKTDPDGISRLTERSKAPSPTQWTI